MASKKLFGSNLATMALLISLGMAHLTPSKLLASERNNLRVVATYLQNPDDSDDFDELPNGPFLTRDLNTREQTEGVEAVREYCEFLNHSRPLSSFTDRMRTEGRFAQLGHWTSFCVKAGPIDILSRDRSPNENITALWQILIVRRSTDETFWEVYLQAGEVVSAKVIADPVPYSQLAQQ